MFWCFKYMVYCRDQVYRCQNRTPELNPKVLLDAFLEFKIPAQIPLGVRSVAWCGFLVSPLLVEPDALASVARSCEQHGNFLWYISHFLFLSSY